MDLIEKVFLLREVSLFADLGGEHVALLAAATEERDVGVGEALTREGEPPDALNLVVRGRVEPAEAAEGGDGDGGPGTSLGSWSLVDPAPAHATVRAAEPARVLRLVRADFQEILLDHPDLALVLLEALAARARTQAA